MSSSYSYAASRHRSGGGGMSTTTLLAAKVGAASVALAAAASLARLAVPELVSVAGAVLPRAWAVARFWLAPPYLFVTVHLIILVIWKLSDHKHFHQAHHHKDPWPVAAQHATAHPPPPAVVVQEEEIVPAVKRAKDDFGAAYGGHVLEPGYCSSPEFSPDSGGGDSCVTTESDEDASSAAPSHYYSVEGASRSVVFPAVEKRAVLEREPSLPPPSQTVDDGDDDDLDATWNAIMQKTRSAPAAAPAPEAPPAKKQQQQQRPPPPMARDPSVGAEEMNRRFDDFIKKNRNSFGRQ